MAKHPDPQTLYRLFQSESAADLQVAFQQLGEILLPLARARLNPSRFDQTVVQDCVQEALATIWQKLNAGHGPQKPEAFIQWAISIVVFKCIDHVRYSARHPALPLSEVTDETPIRPLVDQENAEAMLPDHLVELTDEKLRLLLSLRQHPALSEESKLVLIEGFLLEKTDAELATLLNKTVANVQVIRFRNRTKLRDDPVWIAQLRG